MALPPGVKALLPQVDNSPLGLNDLFEIESEVIDLAANWQSFGKALHISPQRLATIKAEPGILPQACLSNTLSEFLKRNYDWEKHGEPSWRLIVTAIAHRTGGDNPSLAVEIAKDHSTGTPAAAGAAASGSTAATDGASNAVLNERPDLRVIGIIRYKRNSEIQEYRAIDEIATEWQAIGRELGLKGSKIKNINGSHRGDDSAAASDMLSFWIGSDLEASWARLIKAMKVKEALNTEAADFEYALLHRVED